MCIRDRRYRDPTTETWKEHDIVIDLYGTIVDKTANNFRSLTRGVKVQPPGEDKKIIPMVYKNTPISKLIPGTLLRAGEVLPQVGPFSIFGPAWADENFQLRHDRPGRVSMANAGKPDSNNSEFFIMLDVEPHPEMDNKNVVFGQVTTGLKGLLDDLQFAAIDENYKPLQDITIVRSAVEDLKVDKTKANAKYLENVAAFRNGDLTKGITLAPLLKDAELREDSDSRIASIEGNGAAIFFKKLLIVAAAFGCLGGVYKYRDVFIPKSNKVVSLRHD